MKRVINKYISIALFSLFFLSPLTMAKDVRVMLVYTEAARLKKGSGYAMQQWVKGMIADFNSMLINEGITDVRLNLIKWEEVDRIEGETFNPDDTTDNRSCYKGTCDSLISDMAWLIESPEIYDIRDAVEADLVIMVVDNSKRYPDDKLDGLADMTDYGWAISHKVNCDQAVRYGRDCSQHVIVRDTLAERSLTLHHELGHAFGLIHTDAAYHWGTYGGSTSAPPVSGYKTPMTLMFAKPPICNFTRYSWLGDYEGFSNPNCHVRMPFLASPTKMREFYAGGGVHDTRLFNNSKNREVSDMLRGGMLKVADVF